MVKDIVKRLFSIIPLLLIISIVLFILINALPGDASMNLIGETASKDYVARLRTEMGLDKPLAQRYLSWLWSLLHGDLGKSLSTAETVAQKISARFPVTMEITLVSMVFSALFALPFGVRSAVKRNTIGDHIGSVISMIGIAMPPFWLGLLLVMLFSVNLGWLPASGFTVFSADPVANIRCILLPCISIGFSFAATIMRQTRSALLEVLQQDYVLTAQAKGLRDKVVIWKHAMRNALIPVLTVIAMQVGRLFGGAVVTETVFSIPGMGREIVNAILNRDYTVAMGMIMVVAAVVVVINALTDILYILVDPRISAQAGKG